MNFIGSALIELQQICPKRLRKWHKGVSQDIQSTVFIDPCQHAVHAVQRCAGHQADEVLRGHSVRVRQERMALCAVLETLKRALRPILLNVAFAHLSGSEQFGSGLLHDGGETRSRCGADGITLGLLDDFLRINVGTVDTEFKMQMRPG